MLCSDSEYQGPLNAVRIKKLIRWIAMLETVKLICAGRRKVASQHSLYARPFQETLDRSLNRLCAYTFCTAFFGV